MSSGFQIKQKRPKRRRELVGTERTITLKTPIFEVRRTNYYRFITKDKKPKENIRQLK